MRLNKKSGDRQELFLLAATLVRFDLVEIMVPSAVFGLFWIQSLVEVRECDVSYYFFVFTDTRRTATTKHSMLYGTEYVS